MRPTRHLCLATAVWVCAGCASQRTPATNQTSSNTLAIGLGAAASSTGNDQAGIEQIVRNISTEFLLNYGKDGRAVPDLADGWVTSGDGLSIRLRLKPAAFHDGSPVTAGVIAEILQRGLPRLLGPAYDDVRSMQAVSDQEVEISLKRPSPFPLEALDINVVKPGSRSMGTGPFLPTEESPTDGGVVMEANTNYHLGSPAIRRIVLKPYQSVRSAWADLLRGNLDMLYEVGDEALDSLEPSSQVKVFSYRRHYAYIVLFNMTRPALASAKLRSSLNRAISREQLIGDGLGTRGAPAVSPVWPDHWAISAGAAGFTYAPEPIADSSHRIKLQCLIGDPAHERLAIALQRQLQSVGVDLDLQLVGVEAALKRMVAKDFDLLLIESISGPSLLRPYLFWHSKGPYNYGGYHSADVDTALDAIRYAAHDDAYRAGVAAFQRAIVDDPPAIFLAWSERARAISTAFDVQVEAGRDPVSTLRLWRPAGTGAIAGAN
jgi:peptide/nickel transport system substrate-binding protein